MPRYFFHVRDGRDLPDLIGTILAKAEDARDAAIVAAGEALRDLGPAFWHHPDWQMHVTDDEGATICDLQFSNQARV